MCKCFVAVAETKCGSTKIFPQGASIQMHTKLIRFLFVEHLKAIFQIHALLCVGLLNKILRSYIKVYGDNVTTF